jgi:N-formylglutamate deformylase
MPSELHSSHRVVNPYFRPPGPPGLCERPWVAGPARADAAIPLVVDSPHSGLAFPPDGRCIAPAEALLSGWDAYVDRLWAATPDAGGTLIAATFHRCYIDCNRSEDDIDPQLLCEPWPGLVPTVYSERGMGLIRRYALPNVPMYDRPLTAADVHHRIERYYRPYHAALAGAIGDACERFGRVWHIDCHSMKSVGNAMNADNGERRPDIVVSDRAGTSADPAFTRWVAGCFGELGYRVTINHPYSGGDIVRRYGAPARGRHSVQVEINRKLYMDERGYEPHAGIEKLESDLRTFLMRLRGRITGLLAATADRDVQG